MKKLFLFYILIGGVLLQGCKEFLDLPPKNQRAVTTLSDLKSVLAGYLDAFAKSNTQPIVGPYPIVTEDQNMMFEAYSDNFDFKANMGQYVNPQNNNKNEKFYANNLLFNNIETVDAIWNKYYETIGFLNALIDQSDELVIADPNELLRVKGEMLVHRAYYVFKLQQYFAPMDDESMGIPLYLHSGKEVIGVEMKRKKSSEVYTVIIEDLKKSLEYFHSVGAKEGYSRFFNERFIQNLLAQVYWFKAETASKAPDDYQSAIQYAKGAIAGVDERIPSTLAAFQSVQQNLDTQYPAIYMQGRNYGGIAGFFGSPWDYMGFAPANLIVASDLLALFDNNDFRKEAYFVNNTLSSAWPDGAAYGAKYVRVHLFTPEEAYLILAEAYFRNNEEGEALNTLNKFKGFRGATVKNNLTGENLLNEIINERRKEFFTDTDKRWIDLKRYKIGNISRNLRFFDKNFDVKVSANDYHYALPIPLAELQENPDIVPNEGWNPIIF
ncbi:RagB/SusD family nutrient uptake outer membrane protein [Sphingobacterium paucimobilis]|uniref:RagB/SusD family nutrient uptake outer membrane protein n=1 Tax=Sphingobacterium paucimobilis HER1398 TaxID=1346330 RepID=U2J5U8_9SPHI|nr:RagB/SusD family nutrient uptake outer membrane protein [Sphingobacterium paucimobilis]ERJ57868.1 hypothetical protein M472_03720 [Sphingobacterium paucimobilis HER1398]ERJ60319.1 hypothetical protein M472_16290 [Sphingobacterium paucimobilis HER1398]